MNETPSTPEVTPGALTASAPVEQTDVLGLISLAAANKDTDPTKLHALLDFYERVKNREAESAFNAAMVKVQSVLPPITKNGVILNKNQTVRSRYAKIEDIDHALKPILSEHGFACTYTVSWVGEKLLTVVLTIRHIGGHHTVQQFSVPYERNEYRTAAQDAGSANSFAKRYALVNAFNISTVDEDDDSQGLRSQPITEQQKNQILDLLIATKSNENNFYKIFGVQSAEELRQGDFDRAIGMLRLKHQGQQERAK
jgi:hypothetical protein